MKNPYDISATAERFALNKAKSVLSLLVYAEAQRNSDLTSAVFLTTPVGSGKL